MEFAGGAVKRRKENLIGAQEGEQQPRSGGGGARYARDVPIAPRSNANSSSASAENFAVATERRG